MLLARVMRYGGEGRFFDCGWALRGDFLIVGGLCRGDVHYERGRKDVVMRVCVRITGEGESQNKGKQIWSYEERR